MKSLISMENQFDDAYKQFIVSKHVGRLDSFNYSN